MARASPPPCAPVAPITAMILFVGMFTSFGALDDALSRVYPAVARLSLVRRRLARNAAAVIVLVSNAGAVPDEGIAGAGLLPVELRALLRMIADFVHGARVIYTAIHHGVANLFAVVNVVQRIRINDNQVSELPRFQRTEILVQTDVAGPVERGAAQRFHVGHAALLQH